MPIHNVFFVTTLFPPDVGGPATYCFHMAEEAVRRGCRVGVLAYGVGSKNDVGHAFSITRVYPRFFPVRLILFSFRLMHAGFGYSAWYAHGGLSATMPALIIGRLLRKRVHIKITGDYAWEQARNRGWTKDTIDVFQKKKYPVRIWLMAYMRAMVARNAHSIIVPSAYLAHIVAGWGVKKERIHIIYNAIQVPRVIHNTRREYIREAYGINGFALVTVARLVPWKGIADLIRAMPDFLRLNPAYYLLIIGDGPDYDALRNVASDAGVAYAVRFFGSLSRADIQKILIASDLFILNSDYEGFSHVLLEAVAAHCPVMARACGGNTELIAHGENGYLLPPACTQEDVIALVEHARTHPAERKMLAENARRGLSRFTFERMAEETFACL